MTTAKDEKYENFKTLLFKEYDYLTDMYINNESLGENRVNIFLALTSAVLAIFAVVSGSGIPLIGDEVDPKFLFVASIMLFALLLFGLITLQRIITRNLETTRYVNKLDDIRQFLVEEKYKLRLKALAYNPYKERKVRKLEKIFSFERGGLLQTIALMNCIIIVGLAISLLSLIHLEFTNNILIVIYIIIVVPVFLSSWIIQMMYTRNKYDEETKKKEEIIKAAGGLVWKEADGLKEIGIIRRSRYDEKGWTLPKGKLIKGEGWKEAAIREVCEEIGCNNKDLVIENFAGGIVYPVEGKPKVVLFWNMKFREEYKEEKVDKEVKEINWLPIKLAIDKMEYPKEAELLKTILNRKQKKLSPEKE